MDRTITNEALMPEDLPPSAAPWSRIWAFALTFDGYGHWGSFVACGEIANARWHNDLTDLRTCLFFEQRRRWHFGETPEGEDAA